MPRADSSDANVDADTASGRTKRACLECRRQKLKCDARPDHPCTRCRTGDLECVVRPRTNAALLANDLKWQQSVETRLRTILDELADVKAANAELSRKLEVRGEPVERRSQTPRPPVPTPPRDAASVPSHPLPAQLYGLRDSLRPALAEVQLPTPLDVSLDDATLLWEHFYDSLAIFHGFTASTDLTTPSPLLFTAVVTASAKRFTGALETPVERWEELFQRALLRLLYVPVPKTWDDVVGLGIARTWFWKADEITSGLIYGSFVETTTPNQNDARDRRVWDFVEMTTVSHGILHLSTPITPDQPPPGVPARPNSHLLLNALNELFDALRVVNRALNTPRSLVMMALTGQPPLSPLNYAEIAVLRMCRTEVERWCPKWLYEIHHAEPAKLPTGSGRDFLRDLLTLYFHVAIFVVEGYLNQAPQPDTERYEACARDLLNLVTGKWADSLHLWPKLFLHSALIAALALPADDPLVRRTHDLFYALAHTLQTSGSRLLHRLGERVQGTHQTVSVVPAFSPIADLNLPMAMAYTGSDSFWADLTGVLSMNQGPVLAAVSSPAQPPISEETWPRDLSHWNTGAAGRSDRTSSF